MKSDSNLLNLQQFLIYENTTVSEGKYMKGEGKNGASEIRLSPSCITHFLLQEELEVSGRKIPSFYCGSVKKIDSLAIAAVPISPGEHQ